MSLDRGVRKDHPRPTLVEWFKRMNLREPSWSTIREIVVVPGVAILLIFFLSGFLELTDISRQWADRMTFGPPWIAAVTLGLVIPLLLNHRKSNPAAYFVWVIPTLLLIYSSLPRAQHFSIYRPWEHYIRHACQAEECADLIVIFLPVAFSVPYSLTSFGIKLFRR